MEPFPNKLPPFDKVNDEELTNFLRKVDDITSVINGMCSKDPSVSEGATKKADYLLGNDTKIQIDEEKVKVVKDRTIINKKAYEHDDKPNQVSPEHFMKSVERDAKERAENRRMSREVAKRLMKEGSKHYRNKEYEKALSYYNQAMDEVRDDCLLYLNRALTFTNLGLHGKAVDDCKWALKLDENNLKAFMCKAKAQLCMDKDEEAEVTIQEALDKHPDKKEFIKDYVNEVKMARQKNATNLSLG
ncbi:tetratricopeptide repeat protein 12 [Nilaparvata lugens]|uniref:tetratricopeptide repeat protein 12 n=1 Tax=Nilaparvata lugens TaxID=108931 RepID=UPI00193D2397|nr:tetratricopeptide repeat protein 12 [Nilaparvata lugens]